MIQFDSIGASAVWGRIAGGIFMIASVILGYYGYDFAVDTQKEAIEIGSAIIGLVGSGLAIYSKVRETKKIISADNV